MKVKVDETLCIGCNLCVNLVPEIFEMKGDVAVAKVSDVPADQEDAVRDAASSCAVDAIIIEE